jgi:uncharacterized membrane protein YidH (DUF202 family)
MPDAASPAVTPAPKSAAEENAMILNSMQLLLAEKRTALSGLRTGIAIFAFPLSVLSVLIATSRLYETGRVLHWLLPLLVLTLGLVVLAIYLVHRSVRRLWHYDRVIREYQQKHAILSFLAG